MKAYPRKTVGFLHRNWAFVIPVLFVALPVLLITFSLSGTKSAARFGDLRNQGAAEPTTRSPIDQVPHVPSESAAVPSGTTAPTTAGRVPTGSQRVDATSASDKPTPRPSSSTAQAVWREGVALVPSSVAASTVPLTTKKPTSPQGLPTVLLSAGCPAAADVRGNLGPASVITSSVNEDWLRHRWQAAADMGGTPIKGPHWVQTDLQHPAAVSKVVIDFETAFADDYRLLCRERADSPWVSLKHTKTKRSRHSKHVVDTLQISPSATLCRFVQLAIAKPGTQWGTSVWELKVFGSGSNMCSAQSTKQQSP